MVIYEVNKHCNQSIARIWQDMLDYCGELSIVATWQQSGDQNRGFQTGVHGFIKYIFPHKKHFPHTIKYVTQEVKIKIFTFLYI